MRIFSWFRFFIACFFIFFGSTRSAFSQDNPEVSQKRPVVLSGTQESGLTPFPYTDHTRKILKQSQIEAEARKFIKTKLYQEALEKAKEAVTMNAEMAGYRSGVAHFLMREALWLQGRYEEALKDVSSLLEINKGQQSYIDEKLELEALIRARDSKSSQPIYGHVRYLKEKHKEVLPPKRYHSTGYSSIVTSTIIRLYDHIGDYDSGISFVDSLVHYFYSKNMFLKRVTTSREALKKAEERGKRWRTYKAVYEYLRVREAFEADKNEGRESCVGKTGVCVGRATQVLIQSDYFPW